MKHLFTLIGAIWFILGCSPKVSEVASGAAKKTEEGTNVTDAVIKEGKAIYSKQCSQCHGQKNVEDYTKAQWSTILPRMAKKANLTDAEYRQVQAYVDWEIVHD